MYLLVAYRLKQEKIFKASYLFYIRMYVCTDVLFYEVVFYYIPKVCLMFCNNNQTMKYCNQYYTQIGV